MNYYRKPINEAINDIKLKMQLGAITLKLSENNNNISSNTSDISNSKTDISSNLSKINTNTSDISNSKTDISSNLSKINTNTSDISNSKTDISSNLSKINTNTSDISNSKTDISSNLSKINTNTSDISNSKTDISSNLSKINTNTSDISSNLTKINSIKENNLKVPDEVFNDRYDIINQSFNFNKNTHSYKLFEKIIENNMNAGELVINTIINYKFDNLENDINRLTHLYEFFDYKNILFYSITLDNHDFGVKSNSDLNISDNFCFNINNKNNIKLVLSLTRINEWGTGSIDLEMINNNYMNIIYNKKQIFLINSMKMIKKLKLLMIKFHLIII